MQCDADRTTLIKVMGQEQACSVWCGKFGKIWSACKQHEVQHAELRMNICIILRVYFYTHHVQQKYMLLMITTKK
jgi:hypothetical protein